MKHLYTREKQDFYTVVFNEDDITQLDYLHSARKYSIGTLARWVKDCMIQWNIDTISIVEFNSKASFLAWMHDLKTYGRYNVLIKFSRINHITLSRMA